MQDDSLDIELQIKNGAVVTLITLIWPAAKSDNHLHQILLDNDRRGEAAIAWSQGLIAAIVFSFHILAAYKSQWETFSINTVGVTVVILLTCAVRLKLAQRYPLPYLLLNFLSVFDGILIFLLIATYSYAYQLPIETFMRAPSMVFLMVYTSARVLKLDPIPIIVAGGTVLAGWVIMHVISVLNGAVITSSYLEYINENSILIGASVEIALGYLAIIIILTVATSYARNILANTADIRELADAKLSAEKSAARQSALFASTTDGMVVVDQFGTIEQFNPALEKLFNQKAEALLGNSVTMLMSDENALKLAADIAAFQQSGESELVGRPYESEGVTSDGKAFPIELSISSFKVAGKLYFTGIIRDITDRKIALANELAARDKFKDVVTSALDAIVVIDESGHIVEFNPASEAIFGFKSEDVIGKDMSTVIVPQHHRKAHREGMAHYLKTGEGPVLNQRIEIDAITAAGESILIELAIKENVGPEGSQFFGYMRDVSKRKAAEDALLEAKERAEVANRAKASFLAMMSHEIRTPLNGVLGILTLLSDNIAKPENVKLVNTARRSGKALLTIINDILDFSKLEAGKLDLEVISFHTDVLVDGVHSLVRQQAKQKGLKLNFNIDDAVPDVLLGDQDRIRQILLNLVWNAIKFTPRGTVSVHLSNVGTPKKPSIRFEVIDTGIGVQKERQHELFTEFATIDSSYARKFGGTGLGLSICKALCEAMDGEIGFTPRKDQGSIFWFEVPLAQSSAQKVAEDDYPETNKDIIGDMADVRILLAEDNVTNQLVVGNMLERFGCTVDTVSDGQEAIDGILAHDYDAILMDVSMPEMDGIAATGIIRKLDGRAGRVPIIALTAYALDEDRQRVLAAGMDDFVSKPISRMELARALSRHIGTKTGRGKTHAPKDSKPNGNLFDEAILAGVIDGMDDELSMRILEEFQTDITRHLTDLNKSCDAGDGEMFERATHGLMGVSGTFGATELQRLSGVANNLLRSGQNDEAFAMQEEINRFAKAVLGSARQRFAAMSDDTASNER